MNVQLAGHVAVVTGASQGIGRAIALALAAAGARVCVNHWQSAAAAASVVHSITVAGGTALAYEADVADAAAVEAMLTEVANAWGPVNLAVSNAAFSDRTHFWELPLESMRRTMDVTLWGGVHLLYTFTRQLLAAHTVGTFVAISSPHAFIPVPRALPYNVAKAGLDMLIKTAAIELAPHRIRVNLIHPGWIDTPGERKYANDEQISQAAGKLPWGRMGTPEEIARGVLFLCDPSSDYITGSSLLIDGGITLPWWASRGSGVPE